MLNILLKFKAIAEKMRDYLPQPNTSNSQTVQVEYSSELRSDANDMDGAGETMADLDYRENLV